MILPPPVMILRMSKRRMPPTFQAHAALQRIAGPYPPRYGVLGVLERCAHTYFWNGWNVGSMGLVNR